MLWPSASLSTAPPSTPLLWPWIVWITSGTSSTFPRGVPCHASLGVSQAVATGSARSSATDWGPTASASLRIPERPVRTSGVGPSRWWPGPSCAGSSRECPFAFDFSVCLAVLISALFVRSFRVFLGGLVFSLLAFVWGPGDVFNRFTWIQKSNLIQGLFTQFRPLCCFACLSNFLFC